MKRTRKRKPGTAHSVSYTDEQWAAIKASAKVAGETTSRWWAKCAMTVDLSSSAKSTVSPLVLDEEQQRAISHAAGDLAEGADDEASALVGALARDLLEERLQAMVREGRRAEALAGLRSVLGDARADVVAAALMPDEPKDPPMPGRQKEPGTGDGTVPRPRQGRLL